MKVVPRRCTRPTTSSICLRRRQSVVPTSLIAPSAIHTSRMPRSPSISGPMGSLPIPSFIHKRLFSETCKVRSLDINNINQNVVSAQYAVRGELAIKSEQYRAQLSKGEGKDLPFDSVISAQHWEPSTTGSEATHILPTSDKFNGES